MEKKKYWPLTLAAFGGGCLLMAAVYFCLGWWPFGTGTVLTGDLRGLYVNYITDMWARVKQGGFFYSFGKLAGGSTLGNLLGRQILMPMVDIGVGQLAMHSAMETASCKDAEYLANACAAYYNTPIFQPEDGQWKLGL